MARCRSEISLLVEIFALVIGPCGTGVRRRQPLQFSLPGPEMKCLQRKELSIFQTEYHAARCTRDSCTNHVLRLAQPEYLELVVVPCPSMQSAAGKPP